MSFQLTFLGYYPIKSQQLKKQTHSIKRRNWSHRERTVQADGPRWTAEADGDCGRPPADGIAIRLRRMTLEDGHLFRQSEGGRPPPSVGRGGRRPRRPPANAAVDVRTRDNPALTRPHHRIKNHFLATLTRI
jgi:hypothetical protein